MFWGCGRQRRDGLDVLKLFNGRRSGVVVKESLRPHFHGLSDVMFFPIFPRLRVIVRSLVMTVKVGDMFL